MKDCKDCKYFEGYDYSNGTPCCRYNDYDDLTGMEGVKAVLYFDNGHTETFVSSWDEEVEEICLE